MAEAVGQDKLAVTKVAGMLRFSVSYSGYPRGRQTLDLFRLFRVFTSHYCV
jgi:hypothetical protein